MIELFGQVRECRLHLFNRFEVMIHTNSLLWQGLHLVACCHAGPEQSVPTRPYGEIGSDVADVSVLDAISSIQNRFSSHIKDIQPVAFFRKSLKLLGRPLFWFKCFFLTHPSCLISTATESHKFSAD